MASHAKEPEPSRRQWDTLGGPDPGGREDELGGPDLPGTDTLGGPDPGGQEDELRPPAKRTGH